MAFRTHLILFGVKRPRCKKEFQAIAHLPLLS